MSTRRLLAKFQNNGKTLSHPSGSRGGESNERGAFAAHSGDDLRPDLEAPVELAPREMWARRLDHRYRAGAMGEATYGGLR